MPETLDTGLAWSAAPSGVCVRVRDFQATSPVKCWVRARLKPGTRSMFDLFSHVIQTQCQITAQ